MPTYQYVCTECGHDFETVQSFSEDALSVCPVCGGRLRKVFNSVGIVFKGSGFYRNDSREKAKPGGGSDSKSDPSKSDSSKSDSDAKSGAKADLKPDAKPKTDTASTSSPKSGDSSSGGGGTTKKGPSSTTGSAA